MLLNWKFRFGQNKTKKFSIFPSQLCSRQDDKKGLELVKFTRTIRRHETLPLISLQYVSYIVVVVMLFLSDFQE